MDFAFDASDRGLARAAARPSWTTHVYPAEPGFAASSEHRPAPDTWGPPAVLAELREQAKAAGLWNLFLPGERRRRPDQPAVRAARRDHRAQPAARAGRAELRRAGHRQHGGARRVRHPGPAATRWLEPLLDGEIRSAFAMTEPDVASSDATNIATRIERDGDEYVINGRKWYITGAMNPNCEIFIVMGKTDPAAPGTGSRSMILVPRDTPGVTVVRGMQVFGYDDRDHGGHAEIVFTDVRVPAANLIGGEGDGFAIAQARLGPGRIHHCMRLIGMAERALELMCRRVVDRVAFGRPLAEQGVIGEWIAESRVRIEQLRLLVLKAAWLMDTVGNKGAHTEIQAIKIAAPRAVEWILDKAIQAHGAGGVSQDFPLAECGPGPARCVSPTARTRCTAVRWPDENSPSTEHPDPDPVPRPPSPVPVTQPPAPSSPGPRGVNPPEPDTNPRKSPRTGTGTRNNQTRGATPMNRFADRVAIVTGAAQGIGAATATLLAEQGATVAVVDLAAERAQPVADTINTAAVEPSRSGPTSPTRRRPADDERHPGAFGRLDILVNNAGITRDDLLFKLPKADWDAVIATNLTSLFLCCQAASRPMVKARYGRIVNLSSRSALGNRGQVNYAAAKAGVQGVTATLSLELGPFSITVNAVAPGFIATAMTDATATGSEPTGGVPELASEQISAAPGRSTGGGRSVIAFLASDEASYVTGQTLYVNGGAR